MTNVLFMVGGVAAIALGVAGCSSDDAPTSDPQSAQALYSASDAWNALPTGPARQLALRASHSYPDALAARCGAPYELDVTVDFGAVTAASVAVNAVTVRYAPQWGASVVPRALDVWSNLTANRHIVDGVARGRGEIVRYDITRDYQLDPNDPIVVLELVSSGNLAATDRACRQVTRFVFYPEGARVRVP